MKINIENINLNKQIKTKLCVLADIHHIKSCNNIFYNEILSIIKNNKPKYILIPGDIIDHPDIITTASIKYLIDFLKQLSKIATVIISKGNHELKPSKNNIKDFYQKIAIINNLYVLDNQSIILDDYQFIGFSPSNKSYLLKYKKSWEQNFIKELDNCNFKINNTKKKIMLCHSPSVIMSKKVKNQCKSLKNLDYVICGHMHNGLAPKCLDKLLKDKGLFGPEYTFFPNYCRGIHNLNNQGKLIVCKSFRVLTKDNIIYKLLDKLYSKNITFINI